MPGVESLRQNQYYAHRRNHFWDIIYALFNHERENDYAKKVLFLKKCNIALWDVLKHCEREGSLDSNIRNEIPNDFHNFFLRYPNIKYVFFNGTTAKRLFKKHIGFNIPGIKGYYQLPSTSPANTRPMEEKLKEWKLITEKLNNLNK
jgi:TDG/mug DNA glycosylase family protein